MLVSLDLRCSEIIDIQKGRHSVDTVLPDDEIGDHVEV
jgi:hypothetical protein